MADTTRLLTVQDAAARLNVPVSWVYVAVKSGVLPSLKIGRYRRLLASELDTFVEAQREGQR